MNIFEYQAKEIFRQYGIAVPRGQVTERAEEVEEAYHALGPEVVLKAQVPAGGRGKAGGVRFAATLSEATAAWQAVRQLVIGATPVERVLVEQRVPVAAELYLGVVISPEHQCPVVLFSRYGGVDVETLVAEHPGALAEIAVDPCYGLVDHSVYRLAYQAGTDGNLARVLMPVAKALYRIFWDYNATTVEINPLGVMNAGGLMALDARMVLDDNAVRLYPRLQGFRPGNVEDRMKDAGIDYVELEGNIAIVSVGAGETMATMDLVTREGGSPACFLDFSARVDADTIETALRTVLGRPCVKVVLFNVFGGLTRIDQVAEGFLEACRRVGSLDRQVVIRVEGTNAAKGRELLWAAGFRTCATLEEAVRMAVELGRRDVGGDSR